MFSRVTATKRIQALTKRIRIIQGGTAASKSISILLILIDLAQRDTKPTVTSVVSESFPHLKRGVMRDFLNIMEEHKYFVPDRWNKTDYIYTLETGSKIEFFSADQPSKVRGPRRERLFINECNNVPYETFDQLEVRTRDTVWLDFNPTTEFWLYEHVVNRTDAESIILTYRDNEALDKAVVDSIEQRKNNKSWWRVYGEGLLGEVETRIYRGWNIIDEVPHEARIIRTGLDFGYSNDETAIVDVYEYNGGYILDEIVYRKGMGNKQITNTLQAKPQQALVIADSAEPKSIDELRSYGINILPCQKGPGSVLRGIQYVQAQRISITKQSINGIKEFRNYIWLTDKDGKIVNEEDPRSANHIMSAVRYALDSLKPNESALKQVLTRQFETNRNRFELNSTK